MLQALFLIALSFQSQARDLKGLATTLDGKTSLYSEVHKISLDESGLNKKIETKYYKPDGQLFAEMTSDFSKNPMVPEVKFTDKRFNKTEELILNPSGNTAFFQVSSEGKKQTSKEIKIKKNMAAGQGFDNFVKINFETLKSKVVPLNFGVLSEMDFFSFKGYKKKDSSNNVVQFGIDLSSFLYRLFSSELILEYDSNTKQILSYKGLSNILDDKGENQSVLIKYEHHANSR